jgi:hypothetical protein
MIEFGMYWELNNLKIIIGELVDFLPISISFVETP